MPRGSNFHKPYPPEFRREAVELVRSSGRPLREIAVDLGVSTETLRMWVTRVEVDAGRREGLTTEERTELRELRRKVKTLEQEREILKKAAVFFSVGERDAVDRSFGLSRRRRPTTRSRSCAGLLGVSRSGFHAWEQGRPSQPRPNATTCSPRADPGDARPQP